MTIETTTQSAPTGVSPIEVLSILNMMGPEDFYPMSGEDIDYLIELVEKDING